jgi:hypothetical protein
MRLSHLGAETGHIHAEGVTNGGTGTQSFDTGTKRTGTRSYKFDGAAGGNFIRSLWAFSGVTGRTYWATCWFYVPAASGLPTNANRLLGFLNGAATLNVASVELTSGGKIRLMIGHDGGGNQAQQGSDSSATVTTDTWYRLDLGVETGAGSVDYAECWLDGTSVASGTGISYSDAAPGLLYWGWGAGAVGAAGPGANKVVYVDDILLQDEQGSVNNTRPSGDEKVVLLLPTADSARDAGWVTGASGTTSLFEAVNNIPPAGLDNASATSTSQIENAVSTTVQEYDATMTTYSAAGIGAADTITAIYALIEGGNSSTTGSDTIGVSVESNPVIAETTPSIDVNDGTFPTGWLRGATGIEENPTVTIGTAPVMSVRKNIASTRVSTVCFMGMYVSYVESLVDTLTRDVPQTVHILTALTRTIGQTARISTAAVTRDVTQTAIIADTKTRSVTQDAHVLVTNARTVSETVHILTEITRSLAQTGSISVAGLTRTIPETVHIGVSGLTRDVPQDADVIVPDLWTRDIPQDAHVLVVGTRSVAETAHILTELTRAVGQTAHVQEVALTRAIPQSAYINQAGQVDVPQDAHILVTSARTITQDVHITDRYTRAFDQDAHILVVSARAVTQTAHVAIIVTRAITQDAAISVAGLARSVPQAAVIDVPTAANDSSDLLHLGQDYGVVLPRVLAGLIKSHG